MKQKEASGRSFTLIELIVVMAIMAILAVVAVPALTGVSGRRLALAAHRMAADIKLARTLATATRRHTWVDFDVSNDSYDVYIESPTTPGRANRIWVTHPETGGQFHVALDAGDFVGVKIQSAEFASGSEVEFDRLGTPYDGAGSALAEDGTVVLVADGQTRTVTVVAETGMVRQE